MPEDKPTIEVVLERVNNWIETTKDYRKSQCDKIDEVRDNVKKIFEWLEKLPCKERGGWYKSMNRQVSFMWAVLAILIGLNITIIAQSHSQANRTDKEFQELLKK
jgi:hypothetical protein